MSDDSNDQIEQHLEEVRKRIWFRRLELGLNLEQMARLCGYSKTMYGDLERGNRKLTLEHVLRICYAAGIHLQDLIQF